MEKMTKEQYIEEISKMKFDAQKKGNLYIELNCKEFMEKLEPNGKNITTCSQALLESLLEGDRVLVSPKSKSKVGGALTVRYYCDNLSPERKKYVDNTKAETE